MLNLIDHLDDYSFYKEAISQDEELARAQVEAAGNTADVEKARNPRLSSWSGIQELLAQQVEETRALKAVLIQVNSKKGAKKPEVRMILRPTTVLEKVRKSVRLANHYKLRDRVLSRYRQDDAASAEPTKETTLPAGTSFVKRGR